MPEAIITAEWKTDSLFHPGTGISRPGYADRVIEREPGPNGKPVLRAERVKGAVRHTAERLCRWYSQYKEEVEDRSMPEHSALQRIFGPPHGRADVRYRFSARSSPGLGSLRQASTEIGADGTASDNSLRNIEHWESGLTFNVTVEAHVPDVLTDGEHFGDLLLVGTALAMTDTLGGMRSRGAGAILCKEVRCDLFQQPLAQYAERLVGHIRSGGYGFER